MEKNRLLGCIGVAISVSKGLGSSSSDDSALKNGSPTYSEVDCSSLAPRRDCRSLFSCERSFI